MRKSYMTYRAKRQGRFISIVLVLLIMLAGVALANSSVHNAPTLSAEHVLLYDLTNGNILYEKDAMARCEPASLTSC